MNNALMVINPYKFSGQWVFDDDDTGLVKEPFVAGIDVMIDKLVSGLNKPSDGFLLIFSGSEFPSYDIKLEWRREDCEETGTGVRSIAWRVGYVPPCLSTLMWHLKRYSLKQRRLKK